MAGPVRETVETGIVRRHKRGCPGGDCKCGGRYEAWVFDTTTKKLIRKRWDKQKEAKLWRNEIMVGLKQGTVALPTKRTFNEAADELLVGMRDGTIKSRSKETYRPSTIRRYELALDKHLRPTLGKLALSKIDYVCVERLLATWWRAGMTEPSSIRNNLDPLRVIVRLAKRRKEITFDPITDQDLPAGGGRREDGGDRAEAGQLLDALNEDRALWATAFYAGLRRGELRALRWSDVDFTTNEIHVRRGWDDMEGEQAPKTAAGQRDVTLFDVLRKPLVEHKLSSGRSDDDLVFGRTATLPFTSSTVGLRAQKRWKAVGLKPVTLHEARHSYASFLKAMGANNVELANQIGHSDSRTTDRIYVHLFKENKEELREKGNTYHAAAQ